MASSSSSSERASKARDRLRLTLSRLYKLEQFDLFFTPSLHVARILLSQLFFRQEQARNQTRYASHYPVTELNVLPAIPLMSGNITLIPHIEMPRGVIRTLSDCQKQGVTDASESFASMLHESLINEAQLFVTRFDRHAELGNDLVLVALRTQDFSTLVRSELRLFEQGLTLESAIQHTLKRMDDDDWRPYNAAVVDNISISSPIILNSSHQPGLPFASFSLPASLLETLKSSDEMMLWPKLERLQFNANVRGGGKKSVNVTHQVCKRLQNLFAAGNKSEKGATLNRY